MIYEYFCYSSKLSIKALAILPLLVYFQKWRLDPEKLHRNCRPQIAIIELPSDKRPHANLSKVLNRSLLDTGSTSTFFLLNCEELQRLSATIGEFEGSKKGLIGITDVLKLHIDTGQWQSSAYIYSVWKTPLVWGSSSLMIFKLYTI